MQLDIYRRPEPEHKLSYLAVPAGEPIPEEVTNVDWVREASGESTWTTAACPSTRSRMPTHRSATRATPSPAWRTR